MAESIEWFVFGVLVKCIECDIGGSMGRLHRALTLVSILSVNCAWVLNTAGSIFTTCRLWPAQWCMLLTALSNREILWRERALVRTGTSILAVVASVPTARMLRSGE